MRTLLLLYYYGFGSGKAVLKALHLLHWFFCKYQPKDQLESLEVAPSTQASKAPTQRPACYTVTEDL
jgi:hypothetical protein